MSWKPSTLSVMEEVSEVIGRDCDELEAIHPVSETEGMLDLRYTRIKLKRNRSTFHSPVHEAAKNRQEEFILSLRLVFHAGAGSIVEMAFECNVETPEARADMTGWAIRT